MKKIKIDCCDYYWYVDVRIYFEKYVNTLSIQDVKYIIPLSKNIKMNVYSSSIVYTIYAIEVINSIEKIVNKVGIFNINNISKNIFRMYIQYTI